MAQSIKTVLVIGGGNVGTPVIQALLDAGFIVSALTRETSTSSFHSGVKVLKTDYSTPSLAQAFQGQDAIVSTVSGGGVALQEQIIDTAIAAGVKVFIPSEYGIDTANPNASKVILPLASKVKTVEYLRSVEDKISWTAIVSGSLFDWAFNIMGGMGGWDIPGRTATIYDGGDIPYEATNLGQNARAVAAALQNPDAVRNQHIYVNSFTITQNQVLRAFEKATGDKFTVKHASVDKLWTDAVAKFNEGGSGTLGAMLDMIVSAFYGKGGVANYSQKPGLWNQKLGLPQEDLDQVVSDIVKRNKW